MPANFGLCWASSVSRGAIAHQPARLVHKVAGMADADGDLGQTDGLIGWSRRGHLSRVYCLHGDVLRPGAVVVQLPSGAVNRRRHGEPIQIPDVTGEGD